MDISITKKIRDGKYVDTYLSDDLAEFLRKTQQTEVLPGNKWERQREILEAACQTELGCSEGAAKFIVDSFFAWYYGGALSFITGQETV